MPDYTRYYSENFFWGKLKQYALQAGKEVVEKALLLYCCLQDSDTPLKAKAVIVGSLGYLILPMDAIPDMIPGIGFTDDIGALVLALAIVEIHIKPTHQKKSKDKLSQCFNQETKLLTGPEYKQLPLVESESETTTIEPHRT